MSNRHFLRQSRQRLNLSLVSLLAMATGPVLATDYRSLVLADLPSAYWRLGETAGPTARDSAGSHDATLNAVVFGRTGAITNDNDTAFGFNGTSSFVEAPYFAELNSPVFSIECWTKANSTKSGHVLNSTSSSGGYDLNVVQTWGFTIQASGLWRSLCSRRIVTNQWTHLVGTFDGSNLCLHVDGVLSATMVCSNYVPNTSNPTRLGASTTSFLGDLDEVAIYDHALTEDRVVLHYGFGKYGANVAPLLIREPFPQDVRVGCPAALVANAYADPAPGFQWYKNGSPIPGATRSSFTLSSAAYSDTGFYRVEIANSLGATNSQPVKLSVMPPPRFCNLTNDLVLHLEFDGDYLDSSGRTNHGAPIGAPRFVTGPIGSGALHYNSDPTAGVYNFVTLGTPGDLQFSSNVNFSVSYWVKFAGTPGDLPFLCNSVGSLNRLGFSFAPSYQQGGWAWSLYAADRLGGQSCVLGYGEPSSINDGRWHHLLHSFDRENEGVTYLDGVKVHSQSIVINPAETLSRTEPVNIGQDASGYYAEPGEADIDDLGVWRRALSSYEAECVFLAGKNHGLSFDSYGPVNILIQASPGAVELIWQAGLLESADDINGPWQPMPGATAPYCKMPAEGIQKFYRVRL